jgi:hypothetical protein
MTDAILQKLIQLAKTPTCYEACEEDGDEYNPGDNGNFDDAFEDGSVYGEILLAREILDNLGISYK